jgi:hypothetical protein
MKMRELAADLLAREKVEEKNTFFFIERKDET